MDIPKTGGFEFAEDFTQELEAATHKMSEENLEELELAHEDGLVLVRADSEAHLRKKESSAPMAPYQAKDGTTFVIYYK